MTAELGGSDAAVQRLGLMDTAPEERFDRITRLAKEVFDVDYAVMNVVDSTTIYTKSQPVESSFTHTPPEDSFCAEAVKHDGVMEVGDAAQDPLFATRGIVAEHGMRFYAGFPIRTQAGETVGTLCLLDRSPGGLSDEKRETFELFGQWAQAEMRGDDPDSRGAATATDTAPGSAPAPSAVEEEVGGGEVRLAALAIPYGEVSGDRSAWLKVGRNVVVTLADVMGKGPTAGGIADRLVTALHQRGDQHPLEAMRSVEQDTGGDLAFSETFATIFHAVVDTVSGHVDYVDAGHGLTLLLSADGTTTRLSSRNLPLGLRPRDVEWEAGEFTVSSGDLIVSVSDGALDAYDSTLESLRMIGEDLRRARGTDAFFDELSVRVSEHTVDDDVTAVVVAID